MNQFPFNQGPEPDSFQRGWAHKLLFGGIVLGVIFVVGLGMFVYTMNIPKQTAAPAGTAQTEEGTRPESSGESTSEQEGERDDATTEEGSGGWFGWLFGGDKKLGASNLGSTSGEKGASQVFNVLSTIKPSAGSSFNLNSFELKLVDNPIPGSTLSVNKRIATAPGEGVYVASSNGSIQYSPDSNFVGTALGIGFQIKDTAGVTFTNVYKPVVTNAAATQPPQPIVCGVPGIQSVKMIDRRMPLPDGSGGSNTTTGTIKLRDLTSDNTKPLYLSTDMNTQIVEIDRNVWYTADGGESWQNRSPDKGSDFYPSNDVLSSSDGQTIFIGGSDGISNYLGYITSDQGQTWRQLQAPTESGGGAIGMSKDGMTLATMASTLIDDEYVATVYVSSDRGLTWNEGATLTPDDTPQAIKVFAGGEIIMIDNAYGPSYESQTLVSTDGGQTFSELSTGMTPGYGGHYNYRASETGLIQVARLGYSGGLQFTTNGGNSWSMVADPTDMGYLARDIFDTVTGTIVFIGSDLDYEQKAWISSDFGASWQDFPLPDLPGNPSSLDFLEDDTYLYGVDNYPTFDWFTKTDGGGWIQQTFPVVQSFDQMMIDLDVNTPGVQRSIDRRSSQGWQAVYDASADELTVDITDIDMFDEIVQHGIGFDHTLTSPGCTSPASAEIFVIIERF